MQTKNPLDKGELLIKILLWVQVLIITVAISIPGIVISLQYLGDSCVVGKQWNIRLDEWLFIASLLHMVSLVSFLPSICCVWKGVCSRIVPLIFIIVLGLWGVLGVYILAVSDLSSCTHNSLWMMSIMDIIFIGIFISVYSIIQFYSCCTCKCNFCNWWTENDPLSLTNSDDDDLAEWLKQTSINTFAPLAPVKE
jgi:hypothetical protein